MLGGLGLVVIAGLLAAVVLLTGDDSDETDVASDQSPTTTAAGSAKGKPCVAMADTPPAGAPTVAVRTGPPPKELVMEDIKEGTGATVNPNDTLTVHYIGVSCSTGRIFDSSYGRGEPASFPLGGVVPGWQQGIPGMKVGGQRLLGIPPELGYGAQGRPPSIAPDETLWFVVEVLDAKAA